ncbi:MAG: hypothetical protein ACLTG4_07670 [Oscillospiraceae bacterium]
MTEDLARTDRKAAAGAGRHRRILAGAGAARYDRAQALELLQQDLRQTKEEM